MGQRGAGPGHIVSALGAATALVSLWLPWLTLDLGKVRQMPAFQAGIGQIPGSQLQAEINRFIALLPSKISGNAWEIMERTDIVFALGAAVAIALFFAVVSMGADPRPVAQAMAMIGIIGLGLVLYKMSATGVPAEAEELVTRKAGFVVALAGWAACAGGAIFEFRNPASAQPHASPATPEPIASELVPLVAAPVAAVPVGEVFEHGLGSGAAVEPERVLVPDFVEPTDTSGSVAPPPR